MSSTDEIERHIRLERQLRDRTAERDAHRTYDGPDLAAERFYRELHVLAVALGVPADVASLDCGERALAALQALKAEAEAGRKAAWMAGAVAALVGSASGFRSAVAASSGVTAIVLEAAAEMLDDARAKFAARFAAADDPGLTLEQVAAKLDLDQR